MLRLPHRRWTIVLSDRHCALLAAGLGGGPQLRFTARAWPVAGQGGLEVLPHLLASAGPPAWQWVDVIVADAMIGAALMPWDDTVAPGRERAALARLCLAPIQHHAPEDSSLCVPTARYGESTPVFSCPTGLAPALRGLLAAVRWRLRRLQPYFVHVYNSARQQLPQDAVLMVATGQRAVLACVRHGRWHSLRGTRLGTAGAVAAMLQVARRECMLQGLPASARICLHSVPPVDNAWLRREGCLVLAGDAVQQAMTAGFS